MLSAEQLLLGANPLRHHVEGAPYQPGERVLVVRAIDRYVHDVSEFVGKEGVVEHLDYAWGADELSSARTIAGGFGNPPRVPILIAGGCGQHYPEDPMVGVRFADGDLQEFWREELQQASPGVQASARPVHASDWNIVKVEIDDE